MANNESQFLYSNVGEDELDLHENDSVETLLTAANLHRQAAQSIADIPTQCRRLTNIGLALIRSFERQRSMDALDAAVEVFDATVKLTLAMEDSFDRAAVLSNLTNALVMRYGETGNITDLNAAILSGEEAAKTSVPTDRAMNLLILGNALELRFQHGNGDSSDLDSAIHAHEEAASLSPPNDPNRVRYLASLGGSYRARFEMTGSAHDWIDAVQVYEKAALASEVFRPFCLKMLKLLLLARVQRTIDLPETEWTAAVKAAQSFQDSLDTFYRPSFFNELGQLFVARFLKTTFLTELDAAVQIHELAVIADHPDQYLFLSNLGGTLLHRFGMTGRMDDVNASVTAHERAVQLLPESHPHIASCLDNLGAAIWRRSERTGSMNDLNRAIEVLVTSADKPTDFRKAYRLNNLAGALVQRFDWTGLTDDLKAAILSLEQAVELLPPNDPERPGILSTLGNAFRTAFDQFGSTNYLDAAIRTNKEAVATTPPNYPHRGAHLSNLGAVLYRHSQKTGMVQDANEAVHYMEQAISLTPMDHPERPMYLNTLCSALQLRFQISKSMSDLNNAISVQQEAVKTEGPERSICLQTLGDALRLRFELTKSAEDYESAVDAYEQGTRHQQSPATQRILSARKAADFIHHDIQRASRSLTAAVNLLPSASPRVGQRDDKQTIFGRFSGLASDAAALSIRATDVSTSTISEALRLLELGRGVIAGAYFDTRSDIGDLRNEHPDLANKFESLRAELDRSTDNPTPLSMTRSYDASKEFEVTLETIRAQDGFQRFLLGPSTQDLYSTATFPIVYLNASRYGADAFIVHHELRHLPLRFEYADLEANAQTMVQTIENHTVLSARRDNEILRKVLDWLWNVAIGPILEELKFTNTRDEWPRVMWVPVGLLSLFPLHAAGPTIDRVISSYTPTLRALGHARDQIGRSKIKNILIATMATTPKRSPLPFIVEETNIINTLPLQRTILQNPSKTQVLEQLAQCSIAHFACHGQVDTNPSKSLLLFADWENDPFSVADMAAVNLDQAQIAVLSACHAANMRNLSLLDESIHMAGACQLAGFPTVIGSLWQVQDQYSPTVSEWLYRAIFKETADITKAAEGLHFAVRKVREDSQRRKFKGKGLDNPIAWAPYIHVGI